MFDMDTGDHLIRPFGPPSPQGEGKAPVEIGGRWTFVPCANLEHSVGFAEVLQVQVTGTVVQIYEEHHWFRVEFPLGPGCIGHECFKF